MFGVVTIWKGWESAPLRRSNGVAAQFGLCAFVGEQQLAPRFSHVPLDVIGEHAEEDVRTNAAFEPVLDGTDFEVHGTVK